MTYRCEKCGREMSTAEVSQQRYYPPACKDGTHQGPFAPVLDEGRVEVRPEPDDTRKAIGA